MPDQPREQSSVHIDHAEGTIDVTGSGDFVAQVFNSLSPILGATMPQALKTGAHLDFRVGAKLEPTGDAEVN